MADFNFCTLVINPLVPRVEKNPPISFNPSVPDAHYSERQDKPFSLQIQQLEFNLKLSCGFLFFAPWAPLG